MSSSSTEESLGSPFLNPTTDPTETLTSTTILNWIHTLNTPPQTLSRLNTIEALPTQTLKRRRSSDTLPSEFLGNTVSSQKERQPLEVMTDNGRALVSGQPDTPPGKTQASTAQAYDPQNGQNLIKTPNKRPPERKLNNPDEIGDRMSDHGLMFKDTAAYNKYPDFVEKVERIVKGNRWSAMKPESIRRFRKYHTYYSRMNEDTVLANVFPIIMKTGYYKMEASEEYNAEGMAEERHKYVDFLENEQIANTVNREFRRTLVPSRFIKNDGFLKTMSQALEKTQGMENPKPDYSFGHMKDRMPEFKVVMPQEIKDLLELVPGLHNAFLIVEAKGDSGSAAGAENQLRRGGATLVNGARILKSNVGDKVTTQGADHDTFVFGATFSPHFLEIFVHWYDATSERYHMNYVETYGLNSDSQVPRSREALHNILQWGADDRFLEQTSLREHIERYAELVDKEQRTKKRRRGPQGAILVPGDATQIGE